MKKMPLVVALSLLALAASGQNQSACNPNEKGMPPQCSVDRHPVAECVCDGPSGPCHWVWHCVPN
jgi:hypothetical protein